MHWAVGTLLVLVPGAAGVGSLAVISFAGLVVPGVDPGDVIVAFTVVPSGIVTSAVVSSAVLDSAVVSSDVEASSVVASVVRDSAVVAFAVVVSDLVASSVVTSSVVASAVVEGLEEFLRQFRNMVKEGLIYRMLEKHRQTHNLLTSRLKGREFILQLFFCFVISVFEIIGKSHYQGQKRTQRLCCAIL